VTDDDFYAGLLPELAALAKEHKAKCEAAKLHVQFSGDGGYRPPSVQTRLYRQGRELTPTGWVVVDEKKVVTNATAAHAPHCRRAAYDLWLLFGKPKEGHLRLATMDPKDGWTSAEIEQQTILWGAVVRIGAELGLEPGAHWPKLKDWPHFQLPDWRSFPMPQEQS
jgi:hypothetical protein